MKNIILMLFLAFGLAFTAYSQDRVFPVDTATVAAAADTITFDAGDRFNKLGTLVWHVVADSLSGATGATVHIQASYAKNAADDLWVDLGTITVDGVQTNSLLTTTGFAGWRTRAYILTPSSTQSTKYQVRYTFRQNYGR